MQYSKLVEYLKSSRAMFSWTVDSENSIRGKIKASPASTTPRSPQGTFTPITALCYMLTGKQYKSLEYAYAATELDIDLRLARAIELASDDVNCNSDGIMLLNMLHPTKC